MYKIKLRDKSFSVVDYIENSIQKDRNYITVVNSPDFFFLDDNSIDFFSELREVILNVAINFGYPNLSISRFDGNEIDVSIGISIYDTLRSNNYVIDFQMLSNRDFWTKLNLFLIPDVIYWRFSQNNKIVHSDRFTTHKRRSYTWFVSISCYLFNDHNSLDEWIYLRQLGIDDKVQLIERAGFGYNKTYYLLFIKKVLNCKINNKDVIRSLTRVSTFFQSRFSYCFTQDSISAFLDFLLKELNIDSSLTAENLLHNNQKDYEIIDSSLISPAADPVESMNYLSAEYIKRVIKQDLERTASISIEAAENFFDFTESENEVRIFVEIGQNEFVILVKRRDTRFEFRIFLTPIFKEYHVEIDDVLVFRNQRGIRRYSLEILRKGSDSINEKLRVLETRNHLLRWI
jgi:hypothetical protein